MSVPYYLEYLGKVMDLAYNTAMKGGAPKREQGNGLDGAGESISTRREEVSPAYILSDDDLEAILEERRKEGK
jgi:hypothetical protein